MQCVISYLRLHSGKFVSCCDYVSWKEDTLSIGILIRNTDIFTTICVIEVVIIMQLITAQISKRWLYFMSVLPVRPQNVLNFWGLIPRSHSWDRLQQLSFILVRAAIDSDSGLYFLSDLNLQLLTRCAVMMSHYDGALEIQSWSGFD